MKPRTLRSLVMHVSTRCDQTCAHCSIWRPGEETVGTLGLEERKALLREARSLGAESVLFTGGEPLLCDHIGDLARTAHEAGLQVQIATNGLNLHRSAQWLCDVVDSVYVSLDGPEEVHDRLRGSRMFGRLRTSLSAITPRARRPHLVARSTLSNANIGFIEATVEAARQLGFDRLSFLAVDTTSDAFGARPEERSTFAPSRAQVADLRVAIARLDDRNVLDVFVIEDSAAMDRIADALDGASSRGRACNAPEWSSVVEADGRVRPCFFQPAVQSVRVVSLAELRASTAYEDALSRLGPDEPVCARCVCPKFRPTGVRGAVARVKTAIRDGLQGFASSERVA